MKTEKTNIGKDMNRRLYIGVPNFKFHHATDEYSGFIGRTKIKERLKDLLTGECGNKVSGAYLITGNRGVGKTTFVNKVINEIDTERWSKLLKDSIVLMLLVVIVNFICRLTSGDNLDNKLYLFVSTVASVVIACAFAIGNVIKEEKDFAGRLRMFLLALIFPKRQDYKPHILFLIHLLAISVLIRNIACCFMKFQYTHIVLAIFYVAFYMVILFYKQKQSPFEIENKYKYKLFNYIHKQYKIIHYVIKQINKPRKIFIKINLGQENIKVLDVLRLISYNITVEYRRFLYSGSVYKLRLILVLAICLFFSWLVYMIFKNVEFSCNIPSCIRECETLPCILKIPYFIYDLFNYIFANSFMLSGNKFFISFGQFVIFGMLLFFYKLIGSIPYFRLWSTPFANLRSLNELLESISASIKREEGHEVKMPVKKNFFVFNKRVEKNYPMSDARDIEKKLITIVDGISNEGFYSAHFNLIFDELDKLESSFSEKQEEFLKSDSFSPDTIRKRREAVYTLLSGLKYLLTTMKAKFVFVAGRELYEAFRADASDRSHYLSSIFNDVIVVPSFMTDTPEDRRHDIFCMTEQYVCRSLIPKTYSTDEYYLNDYKKYLYESLDKNMKDRELVIQKTIINLYNFIVYLTYASKGAPKKMVNLLERHIINKEQMQNEYDADKSNKIVLVKTGDPSFYFRFDYYDMYMFALMARIVLPVVYRFDRGKKHKYGDKLLVTSMFFLDHLYKFHRNSFSWRALEASPEIIDVNKIPELREHINDILHYISQNDLKNIGNGLYDFRFYKKIAQEISFLTRVSETASAFFNFTLDETYSVKQYYQRKLEKIRKEYDSDKIPVKNTIEELASIHFTLGELYLYEEEVADAVVEFDMAVSILYTIEPEEMTSEHIVLLMKAMLSIGIAYEKQNQNDRALLTYVECVKFLIASKNSNISTFGLSTDKGEHGKMYVYPSPFALHDNEPQLYFKDIKQKDKTTLVKAVEGIWQMHPAIHGFLSKIAAFDTLRLLYLPILAKLQIWEKVQTTGLQLTDLKRSVKEFCFLANMMNKENMNILISNFFLKVGDILYYKNSEFLRSEAEFYSQFGNYFIEKEYCNFWKEDMPQCSNCTYNSGKQPSGSNHCDAYYFYAFALRMLICKNNKPDCAKSLMDIVMCLENERKEEYQNWDEGKYILLATILTNLGDTILAELQNGAHNAKERECALAFLREFVERRKEDKKTSIIHVLSEMISGTRGCEYKNIKLIELLSYYIIAYMYFKKGTSNKMASFQCYRILLVLKYHISCIDDNYNEDGIEEVARYFTNCSIIEKGTSFKEMHFEDTSNWMRIFGVEEYWNGKLPDCRNILYDESLETILLYLGIKLNTITKPCQIIGFQDMFKTLRYDNVGSILARIKWLKLMSEINVKEIQLELGVNLNVSFQKQLVLLQKAIESFDANPSEKEKSMKICRLLQSTIEKLYEAISLIKLYGENFVLSNYYVADIYQKMMCVIEWKNILLKKWCNDDELEPLFNYVGDIYNTDVYESISRTNANRYYYKAKEMHDQGRTYKDMINRSCFLNDEFSDQRLHFITAHERWLTRDEEFKELLKGEFSKPTNGCCNLRELFKEVDLISKKRD